jgi:hypothetical protein
MLTRGRLVALGLWLALAIVVWNSIFDAAVNGAAHRYVIEATEAARSGRPYVSMGHRLGNADLRHRRRQRALVDPARAPQNDFRSYE